MRAALYAGVRTKRSEQSYDYGDFRRCGTRSAAGFTKSPDFRSVRRGLVAVSGFLTEIDQQIHSLRVCAQLKQGTRRPCCWMSCTHRTDKSLSRSQKFILGKDLKNNALRQLAPTHATPSSARKHATSLERSMFFDPVQACRGPLASRGLIWLIDIRVRVTCGPSSGAHQCQQVLRDVKG